MKNYKTSRSTWEFIKFAVVGAIGTLIDFGVMNLLTIQWDWNKLVSQAISFCLAVMNNFILNRYWTYPDARKHSFWKQFLRFGLISLIGLLIRTPLFWILSRGITYLAEKTPVQNLPMKPEWIGNNTSLAICIVIVLLWNFFANRKWTFRREK